MFNTLLLPEAYRRSWCVAGGWAACPPLASDMDVWVYGVGVHDVGDENIADAVENARNAILLYLSFHPNIGPSYHVLPTPKVLRPSEGYQHPCIVQQVATIQLGYIAKPIHLMVTNACAPGEIVRGFDISTHAVAINWDGDVIQSPHYTPPHIFPLRLLDTDVTPARMKKISQRFGHPYLEDSVGKV